MNSEVVIVSTSGRGNWLAVELARRGIRVALVDVSNQVGRRVPEDVEGPFGYFRSERLSSTQLERLVIDEISISAERGFTIFDKQGPIELKGALVRYAFEQRQMSELTERYLFEYDSFTEQMRNEVQEELYGKPFERTWPAHLAHQLASNVFLSNEQSLIYGKPLPLFAPFYIRQVTRAGNAKSLDWARKEGVQIFPDAKVVDMALVGHNVKGLEISSIKSGFLDGQIFVWALSSEETKRLHIKVYNCLFGTDHVVSQWSWLRYRFAFGRALTAEVLPVHMALIRDYFLPWTHENFCILQRTAKEGEFDVWIRFPTHERFVCSLLEKMAGRLTETLAEALPASAPRISDMPQEYHYSYEALGAPCHPVFSSSGLAKLRRARLGNVHFDGPECWERLGWESQMTHQSKILDNILVTAKEMRGKDVTA